ncbi:MAG: hypothetical protein K1X89_21910 [Myxococcaceae bacterium]|nr:hypothetical protein [Myxococcaceae bacterium]
MASRIGGISTPQSIWTGRTAGPVQINNGQRFKDLQAFEDFVTAGWKDLQGKPLKGTPEVMIAPGTSFTIGTSKALGAAEWLDGFNKKSPFSATKSERGITLTAKPSDQWHFEKTDVLTLKTGPMNPRLPPTHTFSFKLHDGLRLMMG